MKIYFSKSTTGFYNSLVNKNIPNDAVEISKDKYDELIAGQSIGKFIVSDSDGNPILSDISPYEPTPEENKSRAMSLLTGSDWTQLPDVNLKNKDEFAIYRDELRNIVFNPPSGKINFPVKPVEIWE